MKKKIIRWIFIVLGALGIADTIVMSGVSNMNEGIVMPLILGLPLLIYGLFYNRLNEWMKKGFGRFLKILVGIGYAAFIVFFIVCCTVMIAAQGTPPESGADAIIILGGGVKGHVATIAVQTRLEAAIGYLNANPKTIAVVSGGQGRQEEVPEALVMEEYLLRAGIDESRIIQEDKSTSTWENFVNSKAILDRKFGKNYKVVYVTNEFHIYRAGLTAKKAGLNAEGLSSPSALYLYPNNFLRETLAIGKTWVFGID